MASTATDATDDLQQPDCVTDLRMVHQISEQVVLSSHLIPCEPKSGLWNDHYEQFLQPWLEILNPAVRRATGLDDSPDG